MIQDLYGINKYLVNIRRELHQIPEIEFDLVDTLNVVRRELMSMDLKVFENYGQSSIVALIEGKNKGKTIALRADMDALLVCEENQCEYKSKNEGKMHACGHDGHMAMLLGAAKILCQNKDVLNGNVKLIFQASEEGPGSGAKLLVNDGVMDDVENIIALHLTNEYPVGVVAANIGPSMASARKFDIDITGKGGHAGSPHEAIDAIALAVKVINDIQYIISREIDPLESAVINIGTIKGGYASNVVAEKVSMSGTIRTFSLDLERKIMEKIKNLLDSIVLVNGVKYEFKYNAGLPPLYNDEEIVNKVSQSVEKVTGKKLEILKKPQMGSEDFVYYLEKTKGSIVWLGSGNKGKGFDRSLHNPRFDFDEDALKVGCEIFVQYVLDSLK